MSKYVKKANAIVGEHHPVMTSILPRAEALALPDLVRLAMDVPDREMIGKINMIKAENKGKANRRVYFSLEG
jgi:misacylated tRNA(Ala) deacylase